MHAEQEHTKSRCISTLSAGARTELENIQIRKVQQDDQDEDVEKVQADQQDDLEEATSKMAKMRMRSLYRMTISVARIRMKIRDGRICIMTRRG
jgi:hypothetical protein